MSRHKIAVQLRLDERRAAAPPRQEPSDADLDSLMAQIMAKRTTADERYVERIKRLADGLPDDNRKQGQ